MNDTPLVLIVDDVEVNRSILADRMLAMGLNSVEAENGLSALAVIEKQSPDLILLDIMMPVMDGMEVLDLITKNEEWRHIPVIMISAVEEFDTVVKCIESGAADYLIKPFNPILLTARIKSSLEKKRLHDQEVMLREELEKCLSSLKQAEQARNGLSHMIVHDLNNPLTNIIGFLQLMAMNLEKGNNDPVKQLNQVTTMTRSSQQMLVLIQGILDVSRMEAGRMPVKLENVDVSELVSQVVDMFQAINNAGKQVTWDHVMNLTANADRDLTLRIIQNLVNNGLKHTASGTEVRITLESTDSEILVSVKDNGVGISANFHQKVFDKFFQVESQEQGAKIGAGLGLPFCKMAAEIQNGYLDLHSEPGCGSEFILRLPIGREK